MHFRIEGWKPEPIVLTVQATALMFHTQHVTGNPVPAWVLDRFLDVAAEYPVWAYPAVML